MNSMLIHILKKIQLSLGCQRSGLKKLSDNTLKSDCRTVRNNSMEEIDKYQFLKFSQERPQARLFRRCNQ